MTWRHRLRVLQDFLGRNDKKCRNGIIAFQVNGKDAFPRATEMALDLATALGIDATSAATMLGKALETPGEGMLRLKAAGVALDDETIVDQINGRGGRCCWRAAMIMDALAQSVGGAAQASGETFAGKLDILKNTLSNVGEDIGNAVLPMLTEFAGQLLTFCAIRRIYHMGG